MKIFNIESELEVVNFYELPLDAQKEFEESEESIFAFYRNQWHDIGNFIRLKNNPWVNNPPKELDGFDGYNSMGFIGGYLVKFENNSNESVTMAMY